MSNTVSLVANNIDTFKSVSLYLAVTINLICVLGIMYDEELTYTFSSENL